MKNQLRYLLTAMVIFALTPVGSLAVEDLGAHRMEGFSEFQRIIDERCTICHTRERIDEAIRQRRNFEEIERRMIEFGAVLDPRDRSVLGTFWGDPLKEKGRAAETSTEPAMADAHSAEAARPSGYLEYQRIIRERCTLCHTRERIDQAIANRLPFESLVEIMIKRGAILTERERKVLGTFWGEPLK